MKTNYPFQDQPIPLIIYDHITNKYVLQDKAIQMINSLQNLPLSIIGVAGMYRTGKSYLLNQVILNTNQGFSVGSTINPCTKGIWLWGRPLQGQTQDGQACNILVIDSEGIGALDQESNNDSKIFSLMILLSSCFIYNSVGSIDEDAIQNLSLIINLTKHIQLKTNQHLNDHSDQTYSQYFPKFYWVLRDFSLQLVDQDGEEINEKQYLENSLQLQNGVSDQVEAKNRVRRMLTTFFQERECVTIVRPLTTEASLQNLENIPLDQLRPQFIEQINQLRAKIFEKTKIKSINNCQLTGPMYIDLVKSYLEGINNGIIPNIENAWVYISQNQCQKIGAELFEFYETQLKNMQQNKIPCFLEDLKSEYKQLKDQIIKKFLNQAVGDNQEQFLDDLKKKMKQKYSLLKMENEKESQKSCINFIFQEFLPLEKKLKLKEYSTFQEFEKDVRLFYNYYMESGPQTVNKQLYILDFLQKATVEAACLFSKQHQEDSDHHIQVLKEQYIKIEKELKETKQNLQNDKTDMYYQVQNLKKEKEYLENQLQLQQEKINLLQNHKENIENQLKSQTKNEQDENVRVIQDLKNKLLQSDQKVKDLERNHIISQSEFEKNTVLMAQKIEYLQKSVEEATKRENLLNSEIIQTRKENQLLFKETQIKQDGELKKALISLEEYKEKLNDLEKEAQQKLQTAENNIQKLEQLNFKYQEQSSYLQSQNNTLIAKLSLKEKEIQESNQSNQIQQSLEEQNHKIQELEYTLKQKEDLLKSNKANYEKDMALITQKKYFAELQLEEIKKQLEETKKAHEGILKIFENPYEGSHNTIKIQELKDSHKFEIKHLENQIEELKRQLHIKEENYQEKLNDLENKLKQQIEDQQQENENLISKLQDSNEIIIKQTQQIKQLENQKYLNNQEIENNYNKKIMSLQHQLEQTHIQAQNDIQDLQANSQEQIVQLKNYYEIEKERLERRIIEEKEKNDKRIEKISEEMNQKFKDNEILYEDEIDQLKEELREREQHHQNLLQQLEHDSAIKQQSIDALEKQIKEMKENIIQLQNQSNQALDQYIQNFNQERKLLISKSDQQNLDIQRREKECLLLTQKKEQYENQLQKKDGIIDQLRKEFSLEKKELQDKLEELKNKFSKINDDNLDKKIEFGRDLALLQQQNEFLQKKIEELQKQNEQIQNRFEEKIKIIKQDMFEEQILKTERLNEEKLQLEARIDKIKKNNKEQEAQLAKQISLLEKEKAIINEKLQNVEQRKNELEHKLKQEGQNGLIYNQQLKEQIANEKKILSNEIERLRHSNLQIESEKNETLTSYERDKALWEGKFQFLEQQKEQAKQDLVDALKKFEMTLVHLQKQRNNEKEEQEQNLNELLVSIEKKYQSQIEESAQNSQRIIQEYEDKIKRLQKDVKTYKERYSYDHQSKSNNQLEKKLFEYMENEKRLLYEIEQLKMQRENKSAENQKCQDFQADYYKQKLAETEQKLKESEQKRSQFLFEFEKERAKWSLDKEHIMQQKIELLEELEKIDNKKELLLRENEKLKNDSRQSRRSVNPNLQPQPVKQCLVKQLIGNNTSMIRDLSPNCKLNDISNYNTFNLNASNNKQFIQNEDSNLKYRFNDTNNNRSFLQKYYNDEN